MVNEDCQDEPVNVLLVEDNLGDVRLTEEAFKTGRVNPTIHVANDGVEALDFLFQRGEYADAPRPDIVLLDLNLPRTDGDEVLEEMQANSDLSRIPVLILTSSKATEDVERSYELQANAYLTKPVDPNEFADLVQTVEDFWFRLARLPR